MSVLANRDTSGRRGRLPAGDHTRVHIVTTRLDGSGMRQHSFAIVANRDRSVDVDLRSYSGGYVQITIAAGITSTGATAVMAVPIVTTHTDVKHIPRTEDHLPIDPPSPNDRSIPVAPASWTASDATAIASGGGTSWILTAPDAVISTTPALHACTADYQGLLINFQYVGVNPSAGDLGIKVGFRDERGAWTYLRMPARATNDPQTMYVPIRAAGSETPIFLEQIKLGLRGPTKALKVSYSEKIKFIKRPFTSIKILKLTLAAQGKGNYCPNVA